MNTKGKGKDGLLDGEFSKEELEAFERLSASHKKPAYKNNSERRRRELKVIFS